MTTKELNDQVAENIKHYRKQKGWTGAELARQAGMSASTIVNLENGKHQPYGKSLVLLSLVLDVEVWRLFYPEKIKTRRKTNE